jgi:hypothetical protein
LILHAIVNGPIAWQSPRELAARTGLPREQVLDEVAWLDELGWLAVWDRQVDQVVTLTPLAEELLDVHLVEVGPSELPRWARAGDVEPPRPRPRGLFESWQDRRLERLVDPRPTPVEAAIAAEEAAPDPFELQDPPAWPSPAREAERRRLESDKRLKAQRARRKAKRQAKADARRRRRGGVA